MARTITYDKEPVTRFNEIFHDTTTKTTNGTSSAGAYSISFASTTDFTVATEDFPGDLVSGTNIQKGSRVVAKDASSITLNKPITNTVSSGDSVTLYSSMKGLDGGPQGFALLQGSGITLTPTNSNNAGVPTVTLASTASGADGMGAGFVISDGSTTDTITTSETVTFGGTGVDATVSSGAVNYSLDLNELSAATVSVANDSIAIIDADDNSTKKESIADLIAAIDGTGLTASSGSLSVDAAQTQITSVGALTSLSTAAGSTIDLNGGAITVDGTTLSIDSTDTTNLTMTADNAGDKTLTIDAANTGSGAADIKIGNTSGTAVTIGHTTSEVTVGDNLTVTGNLTVSGTTTTISSTTINVDDKNLELGAVDTPTDTTANGGGITLKGATDKTIIWDNTNSNWTSNQDFNIASGKKFRINNTAVFESATELTSTVVTSGLTTVGALNSGSITSGFGSINTGSSTITTSGTLTGGAIVGTSLAVSGTITGDTSLTLDSTTLTTAELGVLDGLTVGTVVASKALTVDASRDITTIRNLTSDGALTTSGALKADGLQLTGGANSAADSATVVAIMDVSEATSQSWTGSSAYTIANYAYGTYRTAKFIVQVSDGTDTDCMEVLVTYEGTSAPSDSTNIFLTTYAYVTTAASDLGTIDAVKNSSDSTIDLQFTPTSNGTYTNSVVNTLLIK